MGNEQGYGGPASQPEQKSRRHWPIFVALGLVLLLIGGAVAAYAYDDSKKDEIADGITIGGVDVGGLSEEEATTVLRRKLIKPLQRPVVVAYEDQTWGVPAKRLKIRANISEAVERALAESREGGLPDRLVRYVSGGSVDVSIKPSVGYSESAINKLVRRVAEDVDRAPVDASVEPTADSLNVVSGQTGQELRDNLLTRELRALVRKRTGKRKVVAKVRETKPEVTTTEVAAQYPTYLTVSQSSFTVKVWKDLEMVAEFPVATGQPAYPTPYGLFSIASKQVDPVWSVPNSDWAGELAGTVVAGGTAENPLKARWMGIIDGVGFHGTDAEYSLGTQASHGCLRMAVSDITEMYDMVPVGTPVYIG